jgi:hypothetical protein
MRNRFLIAYASGAFYRRGTGYEIIDERAQLNELTDRKKGSS